MRTEEGMTLVDNSKLGQWCIMHKKRRNVTRQQHNQLSQVVDRLRIIRTEVCAFDLELRRLITRVKT